MKTLMRFHRYLSCFVAPAMLFFAVSGAWQAFRLQETKKDGSYTAPVALEVLSQLHKAERMRGAAGTAFRFGELTVAAAFVVTAVLGIIMGLRLARPPWTVWLCLAAGVALPLLLVLLVRSG